MKQHPTALAVMYNRIQISLVLGRRVYTKMRVFSVFIRCNYRSKSTVLRCHVLVFLLSDQTFVINALPAAPALIKPDDPLDLVEQRMWWQLSEVSIACGGSFQRFGAARKQAENSFCILRHIQMSSTVYLHCTRISYVCDG